MTTTYLSLAQTTARMAQRLFASDQSLVAFNALGESQQLICLDRAQAKIDAVRWTGAVVEPDQDTAWPRVTRLTATAAGAGGGDPSGEVSAFVDADPGGDGDCQVADIPRAIKDAFAIQAAHEALAASGLDTNAHVEAAARRGVTSMSAGGQSESVDLGVATNPFAALCPEAARRVQHLRIRGGQML